MATIYVPEALNIFVTDQGPDNSKHLKITDSTFPVLEEKTVEHHAGGSIGAIEIGGLGLNALTFGFKLVGFDPQSAAQFGLGGSGQVPYTVYGAVRDKQTGTAIELKATIWGRMAKLDMGTYKRGDASEQTHEIKEITRYGLYWNKVELYYYDFFASIWRVNGVDQYADVNGILRISGGG
ncbi:MAG: phage major tail tube protein [Roseiarcus sp.]|jgi:P2 family phage contractile tail tube protein